MERLQTQPPEPGSLVGSVVAAHELTRVIALGSMGEVYLGRHQTLGVERAIKVIRADLRERAQSLARFKREAQVLARLQHESIVQIVEFGTLPNGCPFLAMELVDGPSLDEMIQTEPLPLAPALIILEQLALALHHAHGSGVIHRDLKPSNVLLRGGDPRQVKLIDFGLARVVDPDVERITGKDQTIGSPIYMAPEQADNDRDASPAVDIYALAGIAYTILSGQPPFTYKSSVRLLTAHASETPRPITERCPHLPPILDDLLAKCLAKEPRHRPTGMELADALRRIPRGGAATVRVESVTAAEPRVAMVLDMTVPRAVGGRGLELATRIMELVEEIATHLSHSNPELLALIRLEAGIRQQLTATEQEFAASDDEKRRNELREQIRTLNAQQLPLQRRMVEVVEAHRPAASGSIKTLFVRIDQMLDQLELLRRRS